MKNILRISPSGFALLQDKILRAAAIGHDPYTVVAIACRAIGYFPKDETETVIEVDYNLDGPVWPFMDWPSGWDREDMTTWR